MRGVVRLAQVANLAHLSTGDELSQGLPIKIGGWTRDDMDSTAQDGHILGNLQRLFELVAHKKKGDTALAQTVDYLKEVGHFGVCQRCRGFIHDDDAGIIDQSATDRGELLVRDGEILDELVEIQIEAQLFDNCRR